MHYVQEFGRVVNNIPLTARLVARQSRQRARAEPRLLHADERRIRHAARQHDRTARSTRSAQYYYSFARGFVLGFNLQGGYGKGLDGQTVPDLQELLRGRYRFGTAATSRVRSVRAMPPPATRSAARAWRSAISS